MRHYLGFWIGFMMKGFKEQRASFFRNLGNYGLFLMTASVICIDYWMVSHSSHRMSKYAVNFKRWCRFAEWSILLSKKLVPEILIFFERQQRKHFLFLKLKEIIKEIVINGIIIEGHLLVARTGNTIWHLPRIARTPTS